MEKESVFELIRKEEMILFAGAGMSLYAGFPSGKELAKILHKNLPISQQNEIELSSDLLQVSEDIFNIRNGNKNYLITKLKECFEIEPSSKETHQLLAKIPQIKTIITTNYDTLFEDTNKNLQVIRRSSDYPIANSKKQQLFKIHGDLSDTTNIILTKSDYNKFFIENKDETVFWTAIKDRLASNNILFIGYSLEDNNVMVMFEKILSEIGENRKELFFVAPSISQTKKRFLDRKGINFIESTGEDLIKDIFEDLKLNYFPGLYKGEGTADIAFNFGSLNQIKIHLSKHQESLKIHSFTSLKGFVKNEVKFNLDTTKSDSKKMLDSLRGKNFDDVLIEGEYIKDWSLFMDGFRMLKDNVSKVWVKKVPNIQGLFDIEFEDGFELENYKIDIFIINPKEDEWHLKIVLLDFVVIVEMEFNNKSNNTKLNVNISPNEQITSVKNGLNFYNIITRMTHNKSFTLFKDNTLFYTYSYKIPLEEDALDAHFLLNYFQKLKKIEQHFLVKFTNIIWAEINEKVIDKILSYIEKKTLKIDFLGFTFKNENEAEIENLLEICKDQGVFMVSENNKSTYNLHGFDFEIGYMQQIIEDAFIENAEDLKNNKTNKVSLKSKSNSAQIQFSNEKDN
ncbi:SIR2 family NAD-dependent protein deacylase [Flavobacterium sp. TSSA_36]|uniref:SIR2 family NAD-dependent protein deacylase n=1 Tax=Flavobacterium sp. TSSA_36 TaxID=3447669 RepID=UPI003F3E88CF